MPTLSPLLFVLVKITAEVVATQSCVVNFPSHFQKPHQHLFVLLVLLSVLNQINPSSGHDLNHCCLMASFVVSQQFPSQDQASFEPNDILHLQRVSACPFKHSTLDSAYKELELEAPSNHFKLERHQVAP